MNEAIGGGEWSAARPGRSFTRKEPVRLLQEDWWDPGPVGTAGKYRPHRDYIRERPAHSKSLYRLSYRTAALVHKDTRVQILYNPVYN